MIVTASVTSERHETVNRQMAEVVQKHHLFITAVLFILTSIIGSTILKNYIYSPEKSKLHTPWHQQERP